MFCLKLGSKRSRSSSQNPPFVRTPAWQGSRIRPKPPAHNLTSRKLSGSCQTSANGDAHFDNQGLLLKARQSPSEPILAGHGLGCHQSGSPNESCRPHRRGTPQGERCLYLLEPLLYVALGGRGDGFDEGALNGPLAIHLAVVPAEGSGYQNSAEVLRVRGPVFTR